MEASIKEGLGVVQPIHVTIKVWKFSLRLGKLSELKSGKIWDYSNPSLGWESLLFFMVQPHFPPPQYDSFFYPKWPKLG